MSSGERDAAGEPPREKENPTYKMVIFDMDGTLVPINNYQENSVRVGVSVWQAVFDSVGALDEHKCLKEKFERGEYRSYMDWSAEGCRVLKKYGLTESKFLEVINSLPFVEGAKEAISGLKERGYKTAIITGGFRALAMRIQEELGIDTVIAHCNLIFGKDGKLETWELFPCDYEDKVDVFNDLIKKQGIKSQECVYIGNDVNDKEIFSIVGASVAFNCAKKEKVSRAAMLSYEEDLRAPLIGIGLIPSSGKPLAITREAPSPPPIS